MSSTEPEKTRKPVKSPELSGIEHLSFVQAEPGCVYEKPFDDFIIYESCRSLNDCHHHEFFKTSSSDAESELEHLKSNVSWCTDIDQFSSKPPFDKTPLEHLKSNVSWCTDITQSSSKPPLDKIPGRPSVEQIEIIREVLENTVCMCFLKILLKTYILSTVWPKTNSNASRLPNNSYKPITNTAWVRTRLCKLQKRVHSTCSRK